MKLSDFFKENDKAAIAFSGGVDSAYLLYAALRYGADVTAYYVKSAFQPQFELNDAEKLAEKLGVKIKLLPVNVFDSPDIYVNSSERCYFCKRKIFETIVRAAHEDGYMLLLDGTNASDDEGDRPGIRAIRELAVRSPLRECGLTKSEIRRLSKEAGLFTWDKPAYACLATRIPTGEKITMEKLEATEQAENYLRSLGFTDFRVRVVEGTAKIQVLEIELPRLFQYRTQIVEKLKKYYQSVTLDLEVRS